MRRSDLPYATISEGLSVFDRENQYRPLQWLDSVNEIDWLYRENDSILLTILDRLPSFDMELSSPVINWTEDSRLESATKLNKAMSASDTYLDFVDPRIAVVSTFISVPSTSEIMEVSEVDYDNSEGWTNAAGDACNIRVVRGKNGSPAVAAAIDADMISMGNFMAEKSDPKDGVGRLPGESMLNYVSVVSQSFSVTKMQNAAEVFDSWGQVPKATLDTIFDVRHRMQYALLFNARATELTSDEGQRYMSAGVMNYIKDGYLDLGNHQSDLTWPILNDYLEDRFNPAASSTSKVLIAGPDLYRTMLKFAREMDRIQERPYYDPDIGGNTFRMETDGGYVVIVIQDKWGLQKLYGLGNWGFLLDLGNMMGAHYRDLPFTWYQNIQAPRSVMIREDTFMGSFSLIMKHQEVHGVIRGGSENIVTR